MLKPTKHLQIDKSLIYLASQILRQVEKNTIIEFNVLCDHLKKKYSNESKFLEISPLIVPSLDLLYILGLIEYYEKTDSFAFCGGLCK